MDDSVSESETAGRSGQRGFAEDEPFDVSDRLSVINGVLDAEDAAIATYRDMIDAAEEADDPVTEDLAVTILSDEEAHRTEFRGFQKEYQTD